MKPVPNWASRTCLYAPAAVRSAGTASTGGMAAVSQGSAFGEVAKLRGEAAGRSRGRNLESSEALNWLAKRGITEEVIRTYRLGYLAGENGKPGRFRARSVLGLPPKQRNGKDQTWLFIPRGIVIPTFEGGELINLRIRRPNQDIKEREDGTRPAKYLELSGSCSKPMLLLPEGGNPNLRAFVVVEGELDAILCHHAAGRRIGAVAIRSNQTKPDTVAHGHSGMPSASCWPSTTKTPGPGLSGWSGGFPRMPPVCAGPRRRAKTPATPLRWAWTSGSGWTEACLRRFRLCRKAYSWTRCHLVLFLWGGRGEAPKARLL
ncbi:MAG: hypothetical protein ACLSAH_09600 [Bilophila wadsworthia]